ncbi:MAG: RsmF rRNA methyltransferase first C-terminal domain-containing protein [Lachnospiraceae bacterium]|nr:RsmF rRNA methyltransferase first C-terminal domain-containing protein [Lachnospiraceae bacterium]
MLPTDYIQRMKELLKDEYEDYLRSFEIKSYKALRLNPLQADEARLLALLEKPDIVNGALNGGEKPERVPWEPFGYYYDDGAKPGVSPYHEAGAYYIQEPSAMKPVTMMEWHKTEDIPKLRVLDLCAAPGGKTTQIASYMKGRGVLVCNEYVPQRARILSQNIERMGVRNAIVINETPASLKDVFISYFDRILVDAPCSGEGMFRKNPEAVNEWSSDNVDMCAGRQDEILDCAAMMLKPGGIMVYSTCTFSPQEDEECISRFINRHPDYELVGMEKLYPHKVKGEGHFAAELKRSGEAHDGYCTKGTVDGTIFSEFISGNGNAARDVKNTSAGKRVMGKNGQGNGKSAVKQALRSDFLKGIIREESLKFSDGGCAWGDGKLVFFGDNIYLVPMDAPGFDGLRVLRPGLQLGTLKKDRFEPAHALALAIGSEDAERTVDITYDEAKAYLAGMSITLTGDESDVNGEMDNGWCLVCLDGLSLGWGKITGNVVKNHYPKGLRKQA